MYSVGLILGLTLLISPAVGAAPPEAAKSGRPAAAVETGISAHSHGIKSYGKLPLRFELNRGQTDSQVKFLSRGSGYTLFLTPQEIVLSLQEGKSKVKRQKAKGENQDDLAGSRTSNPEPHFQSVLRMRLIGVSPAPTLRGLDALPGKSNYFRGSDPRQWQTNVPNYSRVRYEGLYPGIDLVYYGNEGRLEYDFVVAPGADPHSIALRIETGNSKLETRNPKSESRKAAIRREFRRPNPESRVANPERVRIDVNGDLVISTDSGEVRFHKPLVYQEESRVESRPTEVESRKSRVEEIPSARSLHPGLTTDNGPRTTDDLNPKSKIQNRKYLDGRYSLRRARPADPKSKIQNPKWEIGFEIASYDPTRPLVIDPVLTYSTYLGGANGDIGYGVAVDGDGNAYVTGSTGSTDFPTVKPFQTATGGDFDTFVAKVNPTGTALVYSTYLGGAGFDRGTAIAVDASGNAYLTGLTTSNNFPTTTGAAQTTFGGGTCGTTACSDAFVTKLNPDGSSLVYSTYLGGGDSDAGQGIALDDSENAYVTGSTLSTKFPTASPFQATGSGSADAFVTKVNPGGTGLVYSTYLGGTDGDYGQAIAVNAVGNAYVTGYTFSTNFPTASPRQEANAGSVDVFVAELDLAGSALEYSTYLGGTGVDRAFALALDALGNVFITGDTVSALDFPGTDEATFGGGTCGATACSDAFVAELDLTGSLLPYSTFLGGSKNDSGSAIALDSSGQVLVTGSTFSDNFPILHALQTSFGGGTCGSNPCSDAFITVLDPTDSTLVSSTFLGGNQTDFGQAIALDASSNAFVTGSTASPGFPATFGVIQVARGGNSPTGDAFLVKVGPADAAAVALSPQKLTFAEKATGFTSAEQRLTLTNSGSSDLSIFSVVVHGDFARSDLTGPPPCGTTVAAGGATCTIGVTFTPTATGDRTGDVTISDSAGGTPHVIPMTGKGITPTPAATLDPTSLEFEAQTYNTPSAAQTNTLTNSGTAELTITKIEISGDFAQTNTCLVTADPRKLPVGNSCTIAVTFTPKASGALTGTLTITDDGSNALSGKHTASFRGTGIAIFTLSSATTAAIVTRGTDSTTFTVKAEGPAAFTSSITLACASIGSATCAFSPATVKVGETSTLTVSNLKQVTSASLAFNVSGTFETQVTALGFTINFADFSLAADPTFGTVSSGDSKTFTITATPTNGFTGSASFTCANLPAETTCTFAPATVTLDGTHPATLEVTVKTTVRRTANAPPRPRVPWPWVGGMLFLVGLMKLGLRRSRRATLAALMAAVMLVMLFLSSCQENYYRFRGTLPGTYSVVFNGKVGEVTHSTFVSLTVN